MISASRVSKVVSGRAVLQDVTLQVVSGESVWLRGDRQEEPTTLLRVLATLIPPTTGVVSVDGLDTRQHLFRARRRLAYVDGRTPGADKLAAGEYIRMIARARAVVPGAEVFDLLSRAGVSTDADLARLPASARSVVAVAAALATRPDVILLDDALAASSAPVRQQIVSSLAAARARGATLIAVAADGDELVSLCGRVVTLEAGRLRSSLASLTQPTEPACTR